MSGNVHTTPGPGQNIKPGDNNQTRRLPSRDGGGSSSQSPATTTNTGLENTSARPVKRRRNNDSDDDDASAPPSPPSSSSPRGCFAAVCNKLLDLDGTEHLNGTDAEAVFGGIYEDTLEGLERLARAAVPEEMRDEEEEEEEKEG
ncbi:hypothetical protein Daesc_001586 [Daldinia eschscholtzii]|uniref:Uncharacterized protein n=1 Tax=Daldinia eschscholtzii TaxID=292717 RepID=A0AAX6MVV1_9PEZI